MPASLDNVNKTKFSLITLSFNYASTIVQIINSILLIPIYLVFFSLGDYGFWISASGLLLFFLMVDPGMVAICAQKFSAAQSAKDNQLLQKNFFSSLALSLVFWVIIISVGFSVIHLVIPRLLEIPESILAELTLGLSIQVGAISISPMIGVFSAYIASLFKPVSANVIHVIAQIASPITILLLLYGDFGLASIPSGYFSTVSIEFIGLLCLITFHWRAYNERRFMPSMHTIFMGMSEIFKDVKYLYIKRFAGLLGENLDVTFAGMFISPQLAASISILKKLFLAIQMFAGSIATSTYTAFAFNFNRENKDQTKLLLKDTFYITDCIQGFGLVAVLVTINSILYLWIGYPLELSYFFCILLALSLMLAVKSTLLSSLVAAKGLFKSSSYIFLIESIVRILVTYVAVQLASFYGLAIGGIVSSLLSIFLLHRFIAKDLDISLRETILSFSIYELFVLVLFSCIGAFIIFPTTAYEALITGFLILLCLFACVLASPAFRIFLRSMAAKIWSK
jgi:O-antigen/teichoic acid export membrane protein